MCRRTWFYPPVQLSMLTCKNVFLAFLALTWNKRAKNIPSSHGTQKIFSWSMWFWRRVMWIYPSGFKHGWTETEGLMGTSFIHGDSSRVFFHLREWLPDGMGFSENRIPKIPMVYHHLTKKSPSIENMTSDDDHIAILAWLSTIRFNDML